MRLILVLALSPSLPALAFADPPVPDPAIEPVTIEPAPLDSRHGRSLPIVVRSEPLVIGPTPSGAPESNHPIAESSTAAQLRDPKRAARERLSRGAKLTVLGWSMFGVAYLATIPWAAVLIHQGEPALGGPTLVPLVGPFISGVIGWVPPSHLEGDWRLGPGLLSGCVQIGGLVVGVLGIRALRQEGESNRFALRAGPGGLQLRF